MTSENAKRTARAMRAKLTNAANLSFPLVACDPDVGFNPTTNIISGNLAYLGKIQAGSFGVPQEFTCILTSGNTADVIHHVTYIAAKGDQFTTEEAVPITVDFETDPTGLTGTFDDTIGPVGPIPRTIIEGSGTGRFEGATTELYFKDGTFSAAPDGLTTVVDWELVRTITY